MCAHFIFSVFFMYAIIYDIIIYLVELIVINALCIIVISLAWSLDTNSNFGDLAYCCIKNIDIILYLYEMLYLNLFR